MQIFVAGRPAVLKKGTSFEYVAENSLFGGSDGYTLTMSFPLKDCPENVEIFGHIDRADVRMGKAVFDCEIRSGRFSRSGCLAITEIGRAEIKAQFLDGKSERNYKTTAFDELYINELTLGDARGFSLSDDPMALISPTGLDIANEGMVVLPWVNTYSGNLQNRLIIVNDTSAQGWHYEWQTPTTKMYNSAQVYLLWLVNKILRVATTDPDSPPVPGLQVYYSVDLSEWEANQAHKYLLVCNTLPLAWDVAEVSRALPHWTVTEFLEKVGLFLGGEFVVDDRAKTVVFRYIRNQIADAGTVRLDDVTEDRSVEVKVTDPKCEYQEAKNLEYNGRDDRMWKYGSCRWFVEGKMLPTVSYNSLSELLEANAALREWNGVHDSSTNYDKLLYAADVDCYFVVRTMWRSKEMVSAENSESVVWKYTYRCRLQQVNTFGPSVVDSSDSAKALQLDIVPAYTDTLSEAWGDCLFLDFGDYDEDLDVDQSSSEASDVWSQCRGESIIAKDHKDGVAEYYDKIFIAFWDGSQNIGKHYPCPETEDVVISDDWSNYSIRPFSLRLNNKLEPRNVAPAVDPQSRATFRWLADEIPDVKAVFVIRGKRYVCEKITATFTEEGMSRLLKGSFYPIVD